MQTTHPLKDQHKVTYRGAILTIPLSNSILSSMKKKNILRLHKIVKFFPFSTYTVFLWYMVSKVEKDRYFLICHESFVKSESSTKYEYSDYFLKKFLAKSVLGLVLGKLLCLIFLRESVLEKKKSSYIRSL